MTNIPYATGYSPLRWRQGTDVELVKKPGNFRVTDMRTIVLFEADFNQNNKLLGRSMMANAEALQQLAPEQYGSRKNLSAIEHGVNKCLSMDLFRQKRLPGGMCINDAKSCYDRIVHPVASICMRRLGVPEAPIVSMLDTIQNMQHHVRTAFGDSLITTGGSPLDTPVHGVGQGNGASPAIWAAVSTPILEVMRANNFGTRFVSALSGQSIQFVGYAFVDDTDICQTAQDPSDTGIAVANHLQEAMTCWAGTLRASGGALVPSKCHWVLIDFVWQDGEWHYASIDDAPATLQIPDHSGAMHTIERLEPTEARRTLGVRLAPDGNNQTECEYLRQVSIEWADRIRSGHLPRPLVWTALTSTILPKLRYPLPATTMSKKQCDSIMSPLLHAALPAAGICRSFPRVLVYAPTKYYGLGVPNLYTEQGYSHITQILRHAHKPHSITGQLLRASMEQLSLELGLPGTPFSQDYREFGILATPCWIVSCWRFVFESQLTLQGPCLTLHLRREQDQFLIKAFAAAGFRRSSLVTLNRCRLFLQAVTLADITTGSGNAITTWAWEGQVPPSPMNTSWDWPVQGRPTPQQWKLWQRALQSTFGVAVGTRSLSTRLGRWIDADFDQWQWFLSPSEQRLYERQGSQWVFHPRSGGRSPRLASGTFSQQSFPVLRSEDLPSDLVRTVLERRGATLVSTGYSSNSSVFQNQRSTPRPSSFKEYAASLPPDARWVFERFQSAETSAVQIAEAIRTGTCIGVSDGSFKDAFGTASWILCPTGQNSDCIAADLVVPGHSLDQSAFRSELAGLYGLVTAVDSICKFFQLCSGSVEIACDGKEALHRCFSPSFVPSPTDQHYDLIEAIHSIKNRCPVQWHFRHVKGHQDDNPVAELDEWAQLNIAMDLRATTFWNLRSTQTRSIQYAVNSEPWSIWIAGRKLCTDVHTHILDHIHGGAALAWWDKKGRFLSGSSTGVDWEACESAMRNASITRRQWIVKHSSGWCGVGKMLKLWKEWDNSDCPRCGAFEDARHVWRCPAPSVTPVWDQTLGRLRRWMESVETQPGICDAICSYLSAWRTDAQVPSSQQFTYLGLPAAIDAQSRIGWQALLEGCLVCEWAAVQQSYYTWIGSRRTGRRWVSLLIRKLWDTAWDLWEHRNGIVHRASVNSGHLHSVHTSIRHQISLGPGRLAASDLPHFNSGADILQDGPPEMQVAWLGNVISARARADRRDLASYRQERASLHRWLQRGSISHR
jgi:hypothetical protein